MNKLKSAVSILVKKPSSFAKMVIRICLSTIELAFIRIAYHGWLHPRKMPATVRIDASTLCQLKCEGCGFQQSNHRGLGGGYLKLADFEGFLHNNPQVKRVELSNYGELFLNPELVSILKCAFEHNVFLEARMGVNFNTVSEEQLSALVDYQFRFLSISIDGASQETYSQYRRGGNYDRVIDNIRRLQRVKSEHGSRFPELSWQYVINQYNEEDIAMAKEMAKELNIPIVFKLNFMKSYKPAREELIRKETGLECLTRNEYLRRHKEPYLSEDCLQFFYDPQFNWDGALIGCCRIENDLFENNLFKDGLKKSLNAEAFVKSKELLLQKHPYKGRYQDLPCWNCALRKGREQYFKRVKLPFRLFG